MKKSVVVLWILLVLFCFATSLSSASINEDINAIVRHAEQYEMGKTSYMQLIVYGSTIKEEINRRLGKEYSIEGEDTRRGLSEDDVTQLFGQPTETTRWVWVVNEEHDERVDEPLPRWEKRLFDGRKISITFNAWPQIIRKDGEIIIFYEADFHIKFKTQYNFDLDDMLKEVKYKATQYAENGQNGEELLTTIAEYQGFLHGYLEENSDSCKSIMEEFFEENQKREKQQKVRFNVNAYEGENLILRFTAESCESCEWPFMNIWFDFDVFGKDFEREKDEFEKGFDESFKEKTIEELNSELEDAISELVELAEESDKAGRFTNPERIGYYRSRIDGINRHLDEKYNDKRHLRKGNYEKRLDTITDILGEFGDVEKEAVTEVRYENRLMEKVDEIIHKQCRQLENYACELDEGCLDGECIEAKGGLEDCHNERDDDNDFIVDCQDPDCAADCGWICRDGCQDECWNCEGRECQSECQECWNCKGDDCEDVCRDTCWECKKEKCESQSFCERCNKCQKEARDESEETRCNLICDISEDSNECEQCQNNLKYKQCRAPCEDSCWECKRENCHDKGICKSCWDCNEQGNKDCNNECNDCWECEQDNCNEKQICSDCRECEEKIWEEVRKEQCDRSCNKCDSDDSEECRECNQCKQEEQSKICEDVCQDECWPCNNEKCESQCEECYECDSDECKEDECEDCWECTEEKCNSQEFCTSCNECQNTVYKKEHPCELPCNMCEDCTDRGDDEEEYCISTCDECYDCETPDEVKSCTKVCNRLIDEKDKEQRKSCYNLCDEGVIFYCNGMPQETPCLNTYYQCPEGHLRIPCFFYTCTEADGSVTKQTAMCGQEKTCGENRIWKDKQCICEEGFYNCDESPENGCESKKPCGTVKEICNDEQDNDFDGLIDCQDLLSCENKFCDSYLEMACKDGECIKSCPENFILNDMEECVPSVVCMVGYEYNENGKCVKIGMNETVTINDTITINETEINATNATIELNETINLNETNATVVITINETGVNLTEEINETEPVLNVTEPEINITEPEINLTEEPPEVNITEEEPEINLTEEPPELNETVEEGPEEEINETEEPEEEQEEPEEEIGCPDGYYFHVDKCMFIEDESEVCSPWQILNENGVCEDIGVDEPDEPEEETPEEEGEELTETEDYCTVREDCNHENAICSMGKCKLLSDEVIEEEEPILVETVETEDVPDMPEESEEPEEEEQQREEEPEPREQEREQEQQRDNRKEEGHDYTKDEESGDWKEDNRDYTKDEDDWKEDGVDYTGDEEPESGEKEDKFNPEANLELDMATGFVVKEKKECDIDCAENARCDPFENRCHCEEYFFDCNGDGEGNDADGCESQDSTCGGTREACRHRCNPNQICVEELGRCECEEGFFECDGDWDNGCESTKECGQCEDDDDCAPSRCNDWDNSVVKFSCAQDYAHMEDTAVVSFSGGCNTKATGKTETYLHFDMWGRDMEKLHELRNKIEIDFGSDWCEREYEGLLKQRKELENSFNQEFLKWFFEDYVASEPAEWEKHVSGIFHSYWQFVDNARELHRTAECMKNYELDVNLIELEYKSEFGEMHFWEEIRQHEGNDIITPFMQIWVFPTKEFIKETFITSMEEGKLPGPDDKEKGPSPKEIEKIKKDEKMMGRIQKLSDKYGGSADFLIEVQDKKETVYRVLLSINPDDIFKLEVLSQPYTQEADINVAVDFNFLYDSIKSVEMGSHLETPPWAEQKTGFVKDIMEKGKIFTKISGAVMTGKIRVSPITQAPTVLNLLKLMAGGSM